MPADGRQGASDGGLLVPEEGGVAAAPPLLPIAPFSPPLKEKTAIKYPAAGLPGGGGAGAIFAAGFLEVGPCQFPSRAAAFCASAGESWAPVDSYTPCSENVS